MRHRGHHRIARLLALLVVGNAAAQELEAELASLDPSVLDRISSTMLEGIGPERDADPAQVTGHRLRSVVNELAAQGRRSTPAGPMAALAAIRLDAVMPELEARLGALSRVDARVGLPRRPLDPDTRARLYERLEVFNSMALDQLRRRSTGSVEDLDEAMSLVLAPIRDVVETISGRTLQSRWPECAALGDGRTLRDLSKTPLEREISRRRGSAEGTDPLVDFLEGLRSQPSSSGPPPDADRIAVLAGRMGAVERRRSDRIATLAELLRRTTLPDVPSDRFDPVAILDSCVSLLEAEISLEGSTIPDGLRAIHRRHTDRANRILDRTITQMSSGSRSVEARLLTEMERTTRDLEALEIACDLQRRLRIIAPPASAESIVLLRTWLRELERGATREQALARFDRLRTQLIRNFDLPGEAMITDPERPPSDLFAGREADLVDRLRSARIGWAREIASGTLEGPANTEIGRLRRLLDLVLESEPVLATDPTADLPFEMPERWAGSYLDADSMSWTLRTLRPGILLAVNAAADGRSARLASDLERLERIAPMVRLTARLHAEFESDLADAPTGDLGALAALSFPPSATACGIEHRRTLALVSRCLVEIAAARARGDVDLADRLSDRLSDDITGLLTELRDSTPPSPPQMETER